MKLFIHCKKKLYISVKSYYWVIIKNLESIAYILSKKVLQQLEFVYFQKTLEL